MMASPLISVVLPFYNNASTLKRAANAILRQTISDLELIMIDDGSVDDSYAIAKTIKDPRVQLYQNDRNRGVSFTRNRGLDVMRGQFMAPMDADDVCRPRRLENTLRVLESNPSIGTCGGWALWRGWGWVPFVGRLPWGADAVRAYMLYGMPSPHDALLFRASLIREHGIRYPKNQSASDDYVFYRQCALHAGVDNVPEVLMEYRCNRSGISNTRAQEATRWRLEGLREELLKLYPEGFSEDELRFHAKVGNGTGAADESEIIKASDWLVGLEKANRVRKIYSEEGLFRATSLVWFQVCRNSAHLGKRAWQAWHESQWKQGYHPTCMEIAGFAGSGVLSIALPSRRCAQGALGGL